MSGPLQHRNGSASVLTEVSHTRFWTHVLALFLLYVVVVVAWGQRNAWPDELLLCLLFLPAQVFVASIGVAF